MRKVKEIWHEHKEEILIGACFAGAVIGGILIGYSISPKLTKEGKKFLGTVGEVMEGATKYHSIYPSELVGCDDTIIDCDDGSKFNVTGMILFGNNVTE